MIRIHKSLILPIALYGAEIWTLRKVDQDRLAVFEMRCLCTILGVHLLDRIRNENIRRRLHIPNTINEKASKKKLEVVRPRMPYATTHALSSPGLQKLLCKEETT